MKCPECDYEMTKKATRVTRSSLGKVYDWTQFHCKYHDIWIELEVPKAKEDEK